MRMTEKEFMELSDDKLSNIVDLEIQGIVADFYGPPPVIGPPWSDQLLVEYRRRLAIMVASESNLKVPQWCPNCGELVK